jgi:hypothetical protein
MQTSKVKKGNGVKEPRVRKLKIQPRIRENRWSRKVSPEIKLCGGWLEERGFHYGKRISVMAREKLLIIRLESD